MAVAALKREPQRKMFYATMHVTRVEEWCIEAESAEEAQELLNSGHGERAHVGECIHCGKEINAKRLDAVPWTRHCIECQEKLEQGMLEEAPL